MDPTGLLYALMVIAGTQNKQDEEKKREEERQEFRNHMDRTFNRGSHRMPERGSPEFWDDFRDRMDKTFKRGKYQE